MTELSDKIIDRIKQQSLHPRPRWFFRLRESGLWSGWLLLFVLFVSAAALLWLFYVDLDLGPSDWLRLQPLLYGHGPILILSALALAALGLVAVWRSTKHGYRVGGLALAAALLAAGVFLAAALHGLGFSGRLDRSLAHWPGYQSREQYMASVWLRPEEGRLAGEITALAGPDSFILKDFSGQEWRIFSAGAAWRHDLGPAVGLKVKLLGRAGRQRVFQAVEIRPWLPSGEGCQTASPGPRRGCLAR